MLFYFEERAFRQHINKLSDLYNSFTLVSLIFNVFRNISVLYDISMFYVFHLRTELNLTYFIFNFNDHILKMM